MTETPIIAIPADTRGTDTYIWHAAAEPYLKAVVAGFGGIPLIVPALGGMIDPHPLLARIDGVLTTGSRSNVHPERYGEKPTAAAEPFDTARDASALPLVSAAIDRGVPLLAICRGMQELNVALGGTLIAEVHAIAGRDDHRAPDGSQDQRFAIRHDVHLAKDGVLGEMLGARTIRVNSLHHQGIGRLADRLAVEATAPDGTIEAVRVADAPAFAIGVQWHPEYWVETDEPSARLFAAFGAAVRERMAARLPLPA